MPTEVRRVENERQFNRTVLLLLAGGFMAVLIAGLATAVMLQRTQELAGWVTHTYDVERRVAGLRLSLEQMRSARRGELLGLQGITGADYDKAQSDLFAGVEQVRRLTADNPAQQRNIAALSARARELDILFDAALRAGNIREPINEKKRLDTAFQVERLAGTMLTEERRLLDQRIAEQRRSAQSLYIVLGLAAVLLIGVGAFSIWTIRRYTHALAVSRNALQRLNDNLEEAVAERTTDLQRANDEIQRFAYIVSHDLRSPLVNVMGFTAELDAAIKPLSNLLEMAEKRAPGIVSEEARLAVAEDLPESIGFIRTSTQKMDRLINAILRLSREGRRTIAPEPLDIGAIVQGAVDAIRHRIDEQGITVSIAPDLPKIVSDRLAMEQILSNLIENAVKYLQPGRPGLIQINGKIQRGRALIDIADNGRGVEARDHERIFDLFRRSGQQDQPGEGIGLAHVRALAYRLGGTISVASELGQGATFTVNLPERFLGEKEQAGLKDTGPKISGMAVGTSQ